MEKEKTLIVISRVEFGTMQFKIRGTAPYVQAQFSEKVRQSIRAKHEAGSSAKKGKAKEPRDFSEDVRQATHYSEEGWIGIPAGAIRSGMISACRLVGFKMTISKLSVFLVADGFDRVDGVPLIRLEAGKPEENIMHTRNATGVADLRARPMWREWGATLNISYDKGQFSATDVANLLDRVGKQVGIGEGRPDSKSSAGLGWGTFEIV